MKNNDLKESTQKAFDAWLKWDNGIEYHPADDAEFYAFAVQYYNNRENMSKKDFVKMCKQRTHTTRREKRGICQKYYERLTIIINFLKWKTKN